MSFNINHKPSLIFWLNWNAIAFTITIAIRQRKIRNAFIIINRILAVAQQFSAECRMHTALWPIKFGKAFQCEVH